MVLCQKPRTRALGLGLGAGDGGGRGAEMARDETHGEGEEEWREGAREGREGEGFVGRNGVALGGVSEALGGLGLSGGQAMARNRSKRGRVVR